MKAQFPPSNRSIPILDDANGVIKLVRDQPPEHCILHIKSFSVLQDALSKSKRDHINSTEFKAGGYTWVLSVYPNGNEEEGGDGHLSVYVTLIDKLYSGTLISASLRFFIYDHIRGNYLTFLGVGEESFHVLKTTRGIRKVLPLESFSDAANGFLVDDCCIFGAGVFLRDGQIKRTIVSTLETECERSYTWKIKNFSDSSKRISSPVFSSGEWLWKLHVYPRGVSSVKGKDVSLFLVLDNAEELTEGSNLYVEHHLCIKNQDGKGVDEKFIGHKWFNSGSRSSGYLSFISISDLHNLSKGLLVEDMLVVEVIMQVMLLLQDTDGTP